MLDDQLHPEYRDTTLQSPIARLWGIRRNLLVIITAHVYDLFDLDRGVHDHQPRPLFVSPLQSSGGVDCHHAVDRNIQLLRAQGQLEEQNTAVAGAGRATAECGCDCLTGVQSVWWLWWWWCLTIRPSDNLTRSPESRSRLQLIIGGIETPYMLRSSSSTCLTCYH